MRKDADFIFLGNHTDEWDIDFNKRAFVALDKASDEVKKAVENLNKKIAEDIRRGEHKF